MANTGSPPRKLPCFPCPHGSPCCAYGATVTTREAIDIMQFYGPDSVVAVGDELRTAVFEGACWLFKGNRCLAHDKPFYPAVCRGFPFADAETGGPYMYDATICPEVISG